MFQFIKTFMEDIQKKALEKQEKFNNYISSIYELWTQYDFKK